MTAFSLGLKMPGWILLLSCAGAAIAPRGALAQAETVAEIAGIVRSADDGAAIPAAAVHLIRYADGVAVMDWSTQSDPLGAFAFPNLPAGVYVIKCGSPGFAQQTFELGLEAGQRREVNFALRRLAYGGVWGVVLDKRTGEPLSGARVVLARSSAGESPRQTLANAQGEFRFPEVLAGAVVVETAAEGYAPQRREAAVSAGEITRLRFEMEAFADGAGVIEGLVTDADTDQPIAGASVFYAPISGPGQPLELFGGATANLPSARTDEQGQYRIENLPAGYWQLMARADGYSPSYARITMAPEGAVQKDFALERRPEAEPGAIAGRVTRANDGSAVAGARVYYNRLTDRSKVPDWWMYPEELDVPHVETGERGFYEIPDLKPGLWQLLVVAPGFKPQHREAFIESGAVARADFALEMKEEILPGRIEGQVLREGEIPVPGARVFFHRLPDPAEALELDPRQPGASSGAASSERPHVVANERGFYAIGPLRPGNYHLLVVAEGFAPAERRVRVEPHSTTIANFRLEPAEEGEGALAGRVVDARTREPIAGAHVVVAPAGETIAADAAIAVIYGQGETNEEGIYRIEGIPAGRVMVIVRAQHYRPARGIVRVIAGQSVRQPFALQPIPMRPAGHVSGVVLNAENEQPLAGAMVALLPGDAAAFSLSHPPNLPPQVLTDRNGRFAIRNVPVGAYRIAVSRRGFERAVRLIVVEAGQTLDIEFLLVPAPPPQFGRLSGIVRDAQSEDPLPGVWIRLFHDEASSVADPEGFIARTNAEGRYAFERIPAGAYALSAFKSRYEPFRGEVVVNPAEGTVYAFAMRPAAAFGAIEGQVVDGVSNEPIAGARVFIPPAGARSLAAPDHSLGALTNDRGFFRIGEAPTGQHTVVALDKAHFPDAQLVLVEEGAVSRMRFELLPRTADIEQVRVRAIDAQSGYAIPHARITLPMTGWVQPGSAWDPWAVFTDEQGYAVLSRPPRGVWTVAGNASGYNPVVGASSADALHSFPAYSLAGADAAEPILILRFTRNEPSTGAGRWDAYP